jgi:hypothetical protein
MATAGLCQISLAQLALSDCHQVVYSSSELQSRAGKAMDALRAAIEGDDLLQLYFADDLRRSDSKPEQASQPRPAFPEARGPPQVMLPPGQPPGQLPGDQAIITAPDEEDQWLAELCIAKRPSGWDGIEWPLPRPKAEEDSQPQDSQQDKQPQDSWQDSGTGQAAADDLQNFLESYLHAPGCQGDACMRCAPLPPSDFPAPPPPPPHPPSSRAPGHSWPAPMPEVILRPGMWGYHNANCQDGRCLSCKDDGSVPDLDKLAMPPPPFPLRSRSHKAESVVPVPPPSDAALARLGLPAEQSQKAPSSSSKRPAEAGSSACHLVMSEPPAKQLRKDTAGVSFCFAPARLAGLVANHCLQSIDKLLSSGPATFKIGLTCDPGHRWANERYGYMGSGLYSRMVVLAETATCEGAAFLEAMLIRHYADKLGCQNNSKGGEGTHSASSGPCFVYLVYKHH